MNDHAAIISNIRRFCSPTHRDEQRRRLGGRLHRLRGDLTSIQTVNFVPLDDCSSQRTEGCDRHVAFDREVRNLWLPTGEERIVRVVLGNGFVQAEPFAIVASLNGGRYYAKILLVAR